MAVMGLWLAGAAVAQQGPIRVELLVAHISDGGSGIDPRGQQLHAKLRKEFRYESLDVLDSQELRLALDQVGNVGLPNGKQLRLRPLQIDPESALLAVEVEGALQTDLRVRKDHLVVIGAERYRDGKLVISLRSRW